VFFILLIRTKKSLQADKLAGLQADAFNLDL
jgi:hypothetical protein